MSRASLLAVLAVSAAPVLAHAQAGDRYGPAPMNPVAATSAPSGAATPFRGRMLSWPGKQAAAAQAYAPPSAGAAAPQGYAPVRYAPAQTYTAVRRGPPPSVQRVADNGMRAPAAAAAWSRPTRAYAAPQPTAAAASAPQPDGWRPVGAPAPALAGAPSRPPLPTSIYAPHGQDQQAQAARTPPADPAAARPTQTAAAQRYGYDPTQSHAVRFYSVHRPFGLQPDPAPIPPQFFTNTADLAEPPAQLPLERTTATATGTSRVVRAAADTSAN
jgi:hypothetical protein